MRPNVCQQNRMSEPEQPASLPRSVIEAICAAANARAPMPDGSIEKLHQLLADAFAKAVRRAFATPLTMADVERVEAAYRRFWTVLEELQDRDAPPPRVPVSDGSTDWEHWLTGHQYFGFKRGRRAKSDWRLIAALLAIYEAISGKRASAAQASGPTTAFLKTALHELAEQAPEEVRSHFTPPKAEALKHQLPRLRRSAMRKVSQDVRKIVGKNRG